MEMEWKKKDATASALTIYQRPPLGFLGLQRPRDHREQPGGAKSQEGLLWVQKSRASQELGAYVRV